ncbi:TetR/AcrR family transcriptional regulator [Micromonospora sp. NBC_01813]|uniref:TetR/AcrR family transcriptional regulator n=1 Tax=Micromonospora sp. NBC_01813 TaxID=2975988 RepID=UPI002DDC8352|nr:TetR/AcrR family transcriptional regulator [Micromonospora sp. NBC_01813]WSA08680.1 TetR/AcrR family transcriptional regulator [Micromonospora sp. NBC_01813]
MSPTADPAQTSTARRDAIADAAIDVFIRYGFKKTSMDDLARAADISRQGLYLHFKTKEELFIAAVERLVTGVCSATQAAFARDDLDVSQRLLGAFEACQAPGVGAAVHGNFEELLSAAATLRCSLAGRIEQGLVDGVERILTDSGVADRWRSAGLTARDLAEHLHATSFGLKHKVPSVEGYRTGMRTAVTIVLAGGDPPPHRSVSRGGWW